MHVGPGKTPADCVLAEFNCCFSLLLHVDLPARCIWTLIRGELGWAHAGALGPVWATGSASLSSWTPWLSAFATTSVAARACASTFGGFASFCRIITLTCEKHGLPRLRLHLEPGAKPRWSDWSCCGTTRGTFLELLVGLENTVFEQMEPLLVSRVATVAAHILGVFVFVSF